MSDERLATVQQLLADLREATPEMIGRVNDAAYEAGFAAGIEAAASLAARTATDKWSGSDDGFLARAIRNLKPEASDE